MQPKLVGSCQLVTKFSFKQYLLIVLVEEQETAAVLGGKISFFEKLK